MWYAPINVFLVACGKNHTLTVTEDGKLYACGSNDFGQLGHDGSRTKLRMYLSKIWLTATNCYIFYLLIYWVHCLFYSVEQITSVDPIVMISVACGEAHSMALNEWGQLYTWGSDSCCQLGEV